MRVHLHIGVQFTRAGRLLKAVRLNERVYRRHDVIAPAVTTYRPHIDGQLSALDGLPPTPTESRAFVEALAGDTNTRAMVLIDERLCGPLEKAFEDSLLHAGIGDRIKRVAELFSATDLHVSMAIANPATFVGHAMEKNRSHGHARWFTRHVPPESISWLPAVDRLQAALPGVPLAMWTEEDTPLIWDRILRHVGALPEGTPVRAPILALRDSLTEEGAKRVVAYIAKFPPQSQLAYEKIAMAFLDKYERQDIAGPEEGIEAWNDAALAEITAGYDDDIETLAKRDGITFIQPSLSESEDVKDA